MTAQTKPTKEFSRWPVLSLLRMYGNRLEEAWVDRTGGIPFHATDCDSDRGDYEGKSHSENKALYKTFVCSLLKVVYGVGEQRLT
ncbi:MAG: hypothetical protein DMG67_02145 [Acidobacteria bacterium]|nr:MAG: hypothetical protein DMG67_02145 [Acidobacteriota bacterium]